MKMWPDNNKISFSEETAKTLFSKFMSGFLKSPVKVTEISSDYKGLEIEFTDADVQPETDLEEKNEKETTDKNESAVV